MARPHFLESTAQLRVLMVCLGNICRSPTAEVVLRERVRASGLRARVEVDSAGTGDWHVGAPPDLRSQHAASERGYDLSALRARPVVEADFSRFDLLLAMDRNNLADLERLRPAGSRAELRLFAAIEVPDPYGGGPGGFDRVLDIVEQASDWWVAELRRRLGSS